MENFTDLDELENKIKELQQQKELLIKSQREPKLAEVKELIRKFGFTASELGFSQAQRPSAIKTQLGPKYRNPADPTMTWAGGRGKRPKWVSDYLSSGGKLSDLEIVAA